MHAQASNCKVSSKMLPKIVKPIKLFSPAFFLVPASQALVSLVREDPNCGQKKSTKSCRMYQEYFMHLKAWEGKEF